MFYLYRITQKDTKERAEVLTHLADLETDKAVLDEMKRYGLHAEDVRLFTKKAEVKEKTEIWIENNGNK